MRKTYSTHLTKTGLGSVEV